MSGRTTNAGAASERPQSAPGLHTFLVALFAFGVAGCASTGDGIRDGAPGEHFDASGIPDALPKSEPPSRYGNPESYVVFGERYHVLDDASGFRERGRASWYGTKFHGRRTSSGETYDMYAMTAAHKTLPLPTYVRVTNLDNGREVIVRVNDRGPFHDGRIIDLSYAAALKLDIVATGTAAVEIAAIDPLAHHGEEPAPENIPAADTGAGEPGAVFIQLGAFSSADNALELKGRLETAGLRPVTVSPGAGDGLFRVRLGPYGAAAAANEATLKLISLGIPEFEIVSEQPVP